MHVQPLIPVHLIPATDLGRLGSRCLDCGTPLDLSHTNPPYRYATSRSARESIARASAGAACPCAALQSARR
jgi:hypothetical protein